MARVKKESNVDPENEQEKKTNELTLSRMEATQDYKREPEVRKEGDFVITSF